MLCIIIYFIMVSETVEQPLPRGMIGSHESTSKFIV